MGQYEVESFILGQQDRSLQRCIGRAYWIYSRVHFSEMLRYHDSFSFLGDVLEIG